MRWLYSLAWYLALPWVLLSLWRRGAREPGYRQHWRERLAWYSALPSQHKLVIWLHAVSVGETRAAQPLLLALLQQYPQAKILLTHMTPTGRATGAELFGKLGERVQQVYMPYDTGAMQARFLRQFAPRLCILMETEVWPNSVAQCQRAG
ncbi:MAG: 3-deoxy-D-manno-octulosonic acid transferase, partial [Burkholderiales bacterium]|nr:3-deoxy-D-manno-octulosonic acid transferase [Burkholderiales bacterium]